MNAEVLQKVKAQHLARNAYVYIRQSTVRQVFENTESKERQYALRQRAISLGWPDDKIVVIDSDLGQSGASSIEREGFKKLVAEVSMGHAGMVLGLEVSRLARNSADWHRLLEISAITDTLILDEDGIYDPSHFNDRLLLGPLSSRQTGTMSEAELHVLRSRLRGGLLNKARRGELHCPLPVGLVYDADHKIGIDPDESVQNAVRLLFDTFARTRSLSQVTKYFRREGLLMPTRLPGNSYDSKTIWRPLSLGRASSVMHNPWYAGAYVYGRGRWRQQVDGRIRHERLPKEQWLVCIQNAHSGYITWEEFERNQECLRISAKSLHFDYSPPREGLALLQGRALCGLCGARMHVHYTHRVREKEIVNYVCKGQQREFGDPVCQCILGTSIDRAIEDLLIESVTPMALHLAMSVHDELSSRADEADRQRFRHVQKAQYDADCARKRYMQVDSANRLVATNLEKGWNEKLIALNHAQEEYDRLRSISRQTLDATTRASISTLVTDFPALWKDPSTPQSDRKRMLGLLIEDVTLTKRKEISLQIRFRGGATKTITIPRPLTAQQLRATDPEVRKQIDTLLDVYTDDEIARIMNDQGLRTGANAQFDVTAIKWIRQSGNLRSLKQRLIDSGMLTGKEIAARLGISRHTLCDRRVAGEIKARICSTRGEWLYWLPGTENANVAQQIKAKSRSNGRAVV